MELERRRRLRVWGLIALLGLVAVAGTVLVFALVGDDSAPEPEASRWSLIEDHAALVASGPKRREAALDEMQQLGADTVRVLARWHEIAPDPRSAMHPAFDAADPAAYPGFGPYDDLVRRASDHGFRILMTLAPDAPRWATQNRLPLDSQTVNFRPRPDDFADFAGAVARRYSGHYRGLPAVRWFSLWNEPNHEQFLKPTPDSPEIYRRMVSAALPRIREQGSADVHVLAGETAAVGRRGKVMGPAEFVRRWLCLDERFLPLSGAAAATEGCTGFHGFDLDGFAHHPYGPAQRIVAKSDVLNLLAIDRLGDYLDRAARAVRVPAGLPIYATEFGLQSNPPDPTVGTTPEQQAALLNEREESSYRYPRLRSFAQYLLVDDPPRPGTTAEEVWSGFQTGLRFADGRKKPAWNAWRLPIAVLPRPVGTRVWGHVRPGDGVSEVQLEREVGARFVAEGGPFATDAEGYFDRSVARPGIFRFRAYERTGGGRRLIGTSRTASPARPIAGAPAG